MTHLADRYLGWIGLSIAGAIAWVGYSYVAPISYEPVGPRGFPLLLAGFLALCSLWLIVYSHFPHQRQAVTKNSAPAARPASSLVVCVVSLVVFALLFQWLGFVVATFLMTLGVGRVFGGTWKQSALAGVGLGIGLFILFDTLLDVVLPLGLLSGLRG